MAICSKAIIEEKDKPQEACGVVGVLAPRKQVAKIAYYALTALQHRGQESAGIATFDLKFLNIHKEMGLITQVFNEKILSKLSGQIAVGHTRYSTMGSSNIENAQPFSIYTKQGPIATAHNGNLVNAVELRNHLIQKGCLLTTTSDSEIISNLIAINIDRGYSLEESIIKSLSKCNGAFSLIIGSNNRLIATRDPSGIRPLCLGITVGGDVIVTSETCSLDIVSASYVREIQPGEIVVIDLNKKIESYTFARKTQNKLCIFELIYFARPDSILYESSVYSYRFNLGKELARVNPVEADIVIPVPESGTIHAIGYSYASKIPYAKGLIKNRNIGRTFIQPTQELRELDLCLKLNPIEDVIKGQRVIVVDDSIVRGTTSKKIVRILKEAGASKVHLRIASAPITHPCFYGIDTDNPKQLIASQYKVKEIGQLIGADSLEFLSTRAMFKACKSPDNYCAACFTGEYPVSSDKQILINKKVFERSGVPL